MKKGKVEELRKIEFSQIIHIAMEMSEAGGIGKIDVF
jgi:hypothetical protein